MGRFMPRVPNVNLFQVVDARVCSELGHSSIAVTLSPYVSFVEQYQQHLHIFLCIQKDESVPTLKAAVRLLRAIFTNAKTITEFQRQVSTPNLPKFSAALVLLIEKHADGELRVGTFAYT